MAYQPFLQIDGKKYAVIAPDWRPITGRQRAVYTGLTGKTFVVDLTQSSRNPTRFEYKLKVFINDPDPDTTWGQWSDLVAAFEKSSFTLIEHDDAQSHTVVFVNPELVPVPRVPAAAASGECNEVYYVDVALQKVYS